MTPRAPEWWALYKGHSYSQRFYTTFGKCWCTAHPVEALDEARDAMRGLVTTLVMVHGVVSEEEEEKEEEESAHAWARRHDCYWQSVHGAAVTPQAGNMLATAATWAAQVRAKKLTVRRVKRFHVERMRFDDAAVSMPKAGTSGVLVFLPGARGTTNPVVVMPTCALEVYGEALDGLPGVVWDEDVTQAGLPFLWGTVLVPTTQADADILMQPWDDAGAAAGWRPVFRKTRLQLAVPLAWVHAVVEVQHDHVPVFRAGEEFADTVSRILDGARDDPSRRQGCGPWGFAGKFECDFSHDRYFIHCFANGRLARMQTWHNFAGS